MKLERKPGTNYVPVPSIKEINDSKKLFTGASFFSGCGGSSTGHKLGGVNILYANEFVRAAQDTYVLNAPNTYMDRRDVRTVTPEDVLRIMGLKKGELDLLDGSPPCSSFSTAGLQDKGWGKAKAYSEGVVQRTDDLFEEFIRILRGIMPKVFVIENVTGMVVGRAKGMFLYVLGKLKDSGYSVSVRALRASRLGVPQARDRLIFVGVRNDLVKLGFEPVHPKPYPLPEPSVRQAFPYIVGLKVKKANILQYVPADVPSPTITASDAVNSETASFSSGGFIETEDGERRKFTIPELKVICGFPHDFEFTGKYEQQFERMGRAVPPMMMAHVTRQIVKDILIPYYKKVGKTPGVPKSCLQAVAKAQKVQAVEWQKVLDAEAEEARKKAERKAAREAKAAQTGKPTSKASKAAQKPSKRATDGPKRGSADSKTGKSAKPKKTKQ